LSILNIFFSETHIESSSWLHVLIWL